MSKKEHWDNIYSKKQMTEVSWYQKVPATSLKLIEQSKVGKNSKLIDVGGGDSYLVDFLLEKCYSDVSVLDISKNAIEKSKIRLGDKGKNVSFVVSDITEFKTEDKFDLWHDRAVFHFLNEKPQIEKYVELVSQSIKKGGHLIVATFSENGPDKCSGIPISKYSIADLSALFLDGFSLENSFQEIHETPFETEQEFTFVHLIKN